ncbi:hypothetical protein Xbed_03484 [Xenorhabdus beddingii]|uniref:Uncharacterized protein n=1 Tax=Xenorhabdus beddingii TaxID=40578 RepID=A0A1Y2SEW3_9GAMM|nr:hypothetical protein Xbed_03484 [Xenorhabdus beddingii]
MLAGLAPDQHKTGTQAFVAGNQAIERRRQGIRVKVTGQAQRDGNMIGQAGRRIELVKEPQALLGKGQWQGLITGNRLDRRPRLLLLSLQLLFDFLF